MTNDKIIISKAKVHNLKSIDVEIPRNKIVVITGVSGSGKSSLAFDTIYAEGQRRYIESLSSYARQFLGQMEPPDVESITGLSPAIAIDQKTTSKNPRSTVGTVTEIYDYLRVLYARIGTPFCPHCHIEIKGQSAEQIVESIKKWEEGIKIQILAPIFRNKKGEHREVIAEYLAQGFSRIRIDGEITTLSDEIKLQKTKAHNIDVVIDRLVIKKEGMQKRLTDSVEYALKIGHGSLIVLQEKNEKFTETLFSERSACGKCNLSFPELEPRLYSFNSPLGACSSCNGLGESKIFIRELMILNEELPLFEGAVGPLQKKNSFLYQMVKCIVSQERINISLPLKKLPKSFIETLFAGSDKIYSYSFKSENSVFNFKKAFIGVNAWLERKYHEASDKTRDDLEQYMQIKSCPSCKGQRLNTFALSTKINNHSIIDACDMPIEKTFNFFDKLKLDAQKQMIAQKLLKEIKDRLSFLLNVGLNYLTLNRSAMTLSGGESQRIRLATQIGSALSGVLYVLDEPSIGLHQRDNTRLIKTLRSLKALGNTVLVVEHDEETMMNADYIIDMGPGAGIHGGEIVACGTPQEIIKSKKSLTGRFLSGEDKIATPNVRKKPMGFIHLKGAHKNNIKNLNVKFPLGGVLCITGVSGSGKSTLIHSILVPALKNTLTRESKRTYQEKNYTELSGVENIGSLIELDQSPIGRTPKSNPATYSGLFDDIRILFSVTPEAKIRGYKPGRFSFNVKGGRCESCEGNGINKIEMHFLPDVYVTCSECQGKRYNKETLSVFFKGKNIFEVLEMSVEEACSFFQNHPKIHRILQTLNDVGLGYMKLGQPATTLSGGEAQRLKLSRELAKKTQGHCLYVLDEPTTGLHLNDIKILLKAIHKLVEQGNSFLIVEHNLDVIKTSDFIIDLGPEGGSSGGMIMAQGTPEEIALNPHSYTGEYLKKVLKNK